MDVILNKIKRIMKQIYGNFFINRLLFKFHKHIKVKQMVN